MINIKWKKIFQYLFLILRDFLQDLCIIIGGLGIIYLIFVSDDKANCLDRKKIYDPIQKICRDDCLTWDDKIGCVPITDENREKKAKGIPF